MSSGAVKIGVTMKKLMLGLMLMGFAGGALAIDSAELETRIQNLTGLFQAMQDKPEAAVPPDVLKDAKGIILLDVGKGGLGFAYQHGSGVAMVRDPNTGKWSAPGFVELNAASFGIQGGGEQAFVVVVITTTNAAARLTEKNFTPGAEARGTAGYSSQGVQSKITREQKDALVYSDRNGLFAGASVKLGGLSPDNDANTVYYSKSVTMEGILLNHEVERSKSADDLIKAINDQSKAKQ
jgi:SH3 domain-containing YSC84-like protein 1